jgi:multiple sugar transport system substrate-binding protein
MTRGLRRRDLAGLAFGLPAAAVRPARAAAPAGEVVYWHHFASQVVMRGFQGVVAQFGARHPAVRLAQETIPNAEYMQKVTAAVLAGSRPDTAMVSGERFADMQAMGALVDLEPRIAAWPRAAGFTADCWDAVARGGRRFGVPAFAFVNWVYWRKDRFDEAGIAGPPDSFEDFLAAARKLTDPARNRYGFGMRGGDGGHQFLLDMLQAWGSPIVEGGNMAIDRAKAIAAVDFYAGLLTREKVVPPSAPNDSFRQIMEGFRTGQTAMIWHHTGSLRELTDAMPAGSFATAIRPRGPAARVAEVSYQYNGLMSERNAEAAWAWVSFWGEPDPAVLMLEQTGYFPASAAIAADPRVAGNPVYDAARATLAFGQPPSKLPGIDAWARGVGQTELQKVLVGAATPAQAVDAMMQGLERQLR